jgi:hypothetical protein
MWIKMIAMGLDLVALISVMYVRSVINDKEITKKVNQKLLENYREEEIGLFKDKTDEEITKHLEQADKVVDIMSLILIAFLIFCGVVFNQYL